MAVKIVRQPNLIALIGAPTSAAAHAPGTERAPAAYRAAGIVDRLNAAGYSVNDLGDIEPQLFQQDDESPRVRNIGSVLNALNALRPKVEEAAKSGALPLVLGGDCGIAAAVIAGCRRYYRHVNLLYFDRHADLNVPASTPSGRVDGMVLATIVGRGAPEMVRFWGEPPLVREPDVVLFGVNEYDPYELDMLRTSPIRHFSVADVLRRGVISAAQSAVDLIHSENRHFVLHFDTDAISSDDYSACNFPGANGLRLADVRAALEVFLRQKNLLAIHVTEFNPERDADGSAAKLLVDLLAGSLTARLTALTTPPAEALAAVGAAIEPATPAAETPAEPPAEPVPSPDTIPGTE